MQTGGLKPLVSLFAIVAFFLAAMLPLSEAHGQSNAIAPATINAPATAATILPVSITTTPVTSAPPAISGTSAAPTALPDTGASLFRVFGAMVIVIGVFFAGVWLFKNWQRISTKGKGGSRLNLIEVKSLGQRQTLLVVGYQEQRMLLASTSTGITLLTQLPPEKTVVETTETSTETSADTTTGSRMSFADAFQQVLNRKG